MLLGQQPFRLGKGPNVNNYTRGSQTGVHVPPGAHFDFSMGTLEPELKM